MTSLDDDLEPDLVGWERGYHHEPDVPFHMGRGPQPLRSAEANEILGSFLAILEGPTGDGHGKRSAGLKPLWKDDPGHYDALLRHLTRYVEGERYDAESNAPCMAHIAWRACALAYQLLAEDGLIQESP